MKKSIHAKRMDRRHRRSKNVAKLNLVSLMDIFTILVFFLLVNSSDVEVLQSDKSIKLPESVADKKPKESVVVIVDRDNILVGGRKVAAIKDLDLNSRDVIAGLKEELDYLAKRKKARMTPEQLEQGLDVNIMADKDTQYTVLKKIMTTCAKSEYRNIALAVSQVASTAEPIEVQAEAIGG